MHADERRLKGGIVFATDWAQIFTDVLNGQARLQPSRGSSLCVPRLCQPCFEDRTRSTRSWHTRRTLRSAPRERQYQPKCASQPSSVFSCFSRARTLSQASKYHLSPSVISLLASMR